MTGQTRRCRSLSCLLIGYFCVAYLVSPTVSVDAHYGTNRTLGEKYDVFSYIDPLIGTAHGGHVFPGATLPFGMAKAVADSNDRDERQGGFSTNASATEITGFSHMHDSGTGGSPSLGNFPIFPQVGCPLDDINNCKFSKVNRASRWINGSVVAKPGYFSILMNTSIQAEMTVTNHTALYRFTFPTTPSASNDTRPYSFRPLIHVDLSDLPDSRINGSIKVDPDTGRITGNGSFVPSFGIGSYDLHFCADFSGAAVRDTGVWVNNRAGSYPKSISVVSDGVNTKPPLPAGAWTQFQPPENGNQILVRVGMSFFNVQQACNNAEREIPDFNFASVRDAAEAAWREKLSVMSIDATGVSDELQTVFWSGTYRSMISPQDYTGENPLWQSDEPYYDSYYCIWDSYRSIHPLLTILDPKSQALMIRSLIDIYRHEGKLPDCRMSLCKGYTQGGSNADVVIADSFLKLDDGDIDWDTAYEAVVSDAEDEPLNWAVGGRGGLHSWKTLGYIPTDDFDPLGVGLFSRSISRTVEYAYNDFCIAEMALKLGKEDDYEKYLERSGNWINMYKADQTSAINRTNVFVDTGFVGFLQPRYLNGTFGYQDPTLCSLLFNYSSCFLNQNGHETYEGSIWLYTFYAPQDMATLVTTLGGPETFTSRLKFLHTSGLLYVGDEQAFLPIFQFHYSGHPSLSSYFAHYYIPSQFNTSTFGLAGNDDSGAMGSFTTLAMMGLWPVSGQDVYLIMPPFFPEVNVTNGVTGKTATIRNIGFDPTYTAIYIQKATLDGKPYHRNWITHDFWKNGGVLELYLGLNESSWGRADEDLPPSASKTKEKFW